MIILVVIVLSFFFQKALKKIVKNNLFDKFEHLEHFSLQIETITKKEKIRLLLNFSLTILKLFLIVVYYMYAMKAFGENVPIWKNFFLIGILQILTLLPISVSGIGVREFAGTYILALDGYNSSSIASMFIVTTSMNYFIAPLFI